MKLLLRKKGFQPRILKEVIPIREQRFFFVILSVKIGSLLYTKVLRMIGKAFFE